MFRNVRALALALLLALVSASAVHARPLDTSSPEMNVVDRFLNWIGTLMPVVAFTGEEGSQMDPNGRPQDNNPSAPTSDAGSSMDPNG